MIVTMGTLSTFIITHESGVRAITPMIERVNPVVRLDIVGNIESMVGCTEKKFNKAQY